MKEQNNKKEWLTFLLKNKLISFDNYYFRLKAKQLNIKTYEE